MWDWILRFVKGILIGSGFILPGVSGGALAAVFGVYETIISFLAHITKDFKKNALYLIPLGLGGVTGVFLCSFAVSFLLGAYEAQILWLFVGCILGTVPALWKQAGGHGRGAVHIWIAAVVFLGSLVFMLYCEAFFGGNVPQSIATWALAGALVGLGIIVPGLSPSNLLIYMGMYKAMADGIKELDFMVIVPVAIGAVLSVLLLARAVDYTLRRAYAGFFHGILGIVFASTIMIVPRDFNYLSGDTLVCMLLCVIGAALGDWMCDLEKKYKRA